MSNLVIVAIPREEDPVWQISSEKVPHLTLLFLGEADTVQNQDKIVEFLEHAAKTSLRRFSLDVDRRGTLGDDEADVVFFRGWDLPQLKQFRAFLLQESNISKAHLAAKQFPVWEPHLTLGYPATPAIKPKSSFDNHLHWVEFDRVALWDGAYNGPEFRLKDYEWEEPPEVSMSTDINEFLSHYGVKGMRWGHRRSSGGTSDQKKSAKKAPEDVTVTATLRKSGKTKIKTTGGKNQPVSDDAVTAKVAIQKAKKSGINSLSNDELRALTKRLELEKKVSELAGDKTASNGKLLIDALLQAA